MKIQAGSLVKIRPSVCASVNGMTCPPGALLMKLDAERAYRVLRVVRDVSLDPTMRQDGPTWVHTEFPGGGHGAYWCHNIEDCIAVPEPVPVKRWPVDRVGVLLRLRRDFCLKWGRYPTVDPVVRQAARDEAAGLLMDSRKPFTSMAPLSFWSKNPAEEWAYLEEVKLRAFGLKPEHINPTPPNQNAAILESLNARAIPSPRSAFVEAIGTSDQDLDRRSQQQRGRTPMITDDQALVQRWRCLSPKSP